MGEEADLRLEHLEWLMFQTDEIAGSVGRDGRPAIRIWDTGGTRFFETTARKQLHRTER